MCAFPRYRSPNGLWTVDSGERAARVELLWRTGLL